MSQASSPCIGVCCLDGAGAFCLGCGRSLAEIAAWSRLPEAERLGIMAVLPGRLAAPERRPTPADAHGTLDGRRPGP